uniref:Uncharacterized protein n=1 Tax=Rhipicephalus zambeziensis TaxID=60191 RepID=A0A224Y8S2_9ACAR
MRAIIAALLQPMGRVAKEILLQSLDLIGPCVGKYPNEMVRTPQASFSVKECGIEEEMAPCFLLRGGVFKERDINSSERQYCLAAETIALGALNTLL